MTPFRVQLILRDKIGRKKPKQTGPAGMAVESTVVPSIHRDGDVTLNHLILVQWPKGYDPVMSYHPPQDLISI